MLLPTHSHVSTSKTLYVLFYGWGCYDLEILYVSKLSLYIFDLSALVCVDMFVFQVGVASVNQLNVAIGPSMQISQI